MVPAWGQFTGCGAEGRSPKRSRCPSELRKQKPELWEREAAGICGAKHRSRETHATRGPRVDWRGRLCVAGGQAVLHKARLARAYPTEAGKGLRVRQKPEDEPCRHCSRPGPVRGLSWPPLPSAASGEMPETPSGVRSTCLRKHMPQQSLMPSPRKFHKGDKYLLKVKSGQVRGPRAALDVHRSAPTKQEAKFTVIVQSLIGLLSERSARKG